MANLKAVALMVVAIMAALSCAFAQEEFAPSPSPVPEPIPGAAAFPASAALVGSSLLLSLLAFVKY